MKYKLSIFSLICAASSVVYFSDGIAKEYDSAIPPKGFTDSNIYICDEQNNCKDIIEVGFEKIPSLKPPLPLQKQSQIECLAQNIYHEARSETLDSMIYVAYGTINRVLDSRFPDSICGVVYQKGAMSWTKNQHKRNMPIDNKYILLASRILAGHYKEPWCKITNWHNPALDRVGSYNEKMILSGKTECSVTIGNHNYIAIRK